MPYAACVALGYLTGTVNPAYLLSRMRGFDIRNKGSGNAGASNALIVFGKVRGVLCALFDILKATVIILLLEWLFPTRPYVLAVTGVACLLGHVFPFYMGFRGGKGLACLGGMILAFDWRVFLILLTLEVGVAFATRYICFVPITASVAFPVIYGILRRDWVGAAILCVMTAVMLFKHAENLRRIRQGKEARMSIIWNRKGELERLGREDEKVPERKRRK